MKKSFYITLFVITIIVILGFYFFVKTGNNFSFSFNSKLPQPEITYAEFPFEVVYEIDGEIVTIQDIYVCEYKGTFYGWDRGFYREWDGYIKGTKRENLFLLEDNGTEVYITVGYPEYYMNDNALAIRGPYTPNVIAKKTIMQNRTLYTSADEEMKYYKIKIIDWTLSSPIENTFD